MGKIICAECGRDVLRELSKSQRYTYKKHLRAFCSNECTSAWKRKISSKTMATTNKKYASERQKKNNTMHKDGANEKLKATLKRIGHKPKIQGGNGRGITIPQEIVLKLLHKYGAKEELSIPTNIKRNNGYPTCYKVDVGIKSFMIAIEVDGSSHRGSRAEVDKKKDSFLTDIGWKVFRIKNEEVISSPHNCISGIVMRIEACICY